MPKSRTNKERKQKLENFKQKSKTMSTERTVPQMPEVQSIPTWSGDAKIEVTGAEWEAIQNGLSSVQLAQQAAQAVMARAMVEGVIKMDFAKLNPQTMEYEPMTDEEKAPYVENFNEAVKKVKDAANQPKESTIITTPE